MARNKITVETSRLDNTAARVDSLADDYEAEYKALFETVKDLQAAWAGVDNTAFTNQIGGFRDDFQRMTKLMRDYAEYLRKVAEAYRRAQEELKTSVTALSQGN